MPDNREDISALFQAISSAKFSAKRVGGRISDLFSEIEDLLMEEINKAKDK